MSTAPSTRLSGKPGTPNAGQIRSWLDSIVDPDQWVEVRAFDVDGREKNTRCRIFNPDERLALVEFALEMNGRASGVYFTLNPIRPETEGSAKDRDIARRIILLIDCDPVRDELAVKASRDAGHGGKLSASDPEKAAAMSRGREIRDYLSSLGWPSPIEADSGNGAHLEYRIELPNDAVATKLVKAVLVELARRFDDADVEVDQVVSNASRVTKLYGTMARKGMATEERPHRPARVLSIPPTWSAEPVTREQLQALVRPDAAPAVIPFTTPTPRTSRADDGRWTPEARAVAYLQKCDPAISGARGHDQTFKVACKVGPGFDLSPETAFKLVWELFNPTCEPPWSEREVRHKIDEAYAKETRRGWLRDEPRKGTEARTGSTRSKTPDQDPPPQDPPGNDGGEEERPAITISTERHEALSASLDAIRADPDLYQRGNALVKVVQEVDSVIKVSAKSAIKHVVGSPKITQLSDANIGIRLTTVATFHRWKQDKHGEMVAVPVHPPDWLIKAVATHKHWPGVRHLLAVAECPFPRPDGSIVEAPGYDWQTFTLLMPSMPFRKLPARPTREDAKAAWGRIAEYFREFPFASEADRAVVLAGILTVIARPAIDGNVPGIAVNSNKRGTGKGKLINGMTIPGTGRECPTSAYPYSNEEAVKVKTSIALAGKVAIHFDNLNEGSSYGSSALDSALTTPVSDDRLLGTNEAPPLVVRAAWFISGNNISPGKDADRRWLVCNFLTTEEHPEQRVCDRPDLEGDMKRDRAALVHDALVILKAHALAGRPAPKWPGFGSFEDWSSIVRAAVWFATDRDCLETQRQAADTSDDRMNKIALLEGIHELPDGRAGDRGVTAQEMCALAEPFDGKPSRFITLRNALTAYGYRGKPVEPRQLGAILKGLLNTPIGGYKLKKHPNMKHKTNAWVVESGHPPEGGSGGEGGSVSGLRERDIESDNYMQAYGMNAESYSGGPPSDPPDPPDPPLADDAWEEGRE